MRSNIAAGLDYIEHIANWFIESGLEAANRGAPEEGLRYLYTAATLLSKQCRRLTHPGAETLIQEISSRIHPTEIEQATEPGDVDRRTFHCLHVLSEAIAAGGLTAMAERWITNDPFSARHDVALLSQGVPIPRSLERAVRSAAGAIYSAPDTMSFVEKAKWLRQLAAKRASLVILHTGSSDVVALTAFGSSGGPPVALVNHTAHTYWPGASVADCVLNCRGSELESLWTRKFRGAQKAITVPIPLGGVKPEGGHPFEPTREAARRKFGLPRDAPVLLTVGAQFKYLPFEDLDFVAACCEILREAPAAHIVVVGFEADDRWKAAARSTHGQIRLTGVLSKPELALLRPACDIYLEGFPFGTTTSLLEAGLDGLAPVLAPRSAPPPFSTDGIAVDTVLVRPKTQADYIRDAVELCRSSERRRSRGREIRASIAAHHTGDGWHRYVYAALRQLPRHHRVATPAAVLSTPKDIHEYWSRFVTQSNWPLEESLEAGITHALLNGLEPKLSAPFRGTLMPYRNLRRGRSVPIPLLVALCNYIARLLPSRWFLFAFRLISFLSRRGLDIAAIKAKLSPNGQAHWYAEYRNAPTSESMTNTPQAS